MKVYHILLFAKLSTAPRISLGNKDKVCMDVS